LSFCSIDSNRIALANDLVIAVWDRFPVNPGHLLIVPCSHVPEGAISAAKKTAVSLAVHQALSLITQRFHPEDFNRAVEHASLDQLAQDRAEALERERDRLDRPLPPGSIEKPRRQPGGTGRRWRKIRISAIGSDSRAGISWERGR
jgi:hypothetical protein